MPLDNSKNGNSSVYWPPHIIDGIEVDLSHLEPFRFSYLVERLSRSLTVDVKFSNHCFTDHFVDGVHDPARIIMDHKKKRVFCDIRHRMSKRLPDMIRGLPLQTVYQTRHERNYVYAATLEDGSGGSYPLFFTLKKERTTWYQLAMMVESAYAVTAEEMMEKVRGGRNLPFAILCANIFENKPVRPKSRR